MIDLDDVQSIILRPSGAKAMRLVFLRASTPEDMRELCARAADADGSRVASVADVDGGARPTTKEPLRNLALTTAGLVRLGVTMRELDALAPAFRSGMAASALRLGDVGPADPMHWVPPFGAGVEPIAAASEGDRPGGNPQEVHAVLLEHWDLDQGSEVPAFDPAAVPKGVEVVGTWLAERRSVSAPPDEPQPDDADPDHTRPPGVDPADLEHFGFRDNITDPQIEGSAPGGVDPTIDPAHAIWDEEQGAWRLVRPGELLLGHVDESGVLAGDPDAAQIERNGSYLVIRRLEQDVSTFWSECRRIAETKEVRDLDPGITASDVAAQVVGRRQDGSVLGREGEGPANDFVYRTAAALLPSTRSHRLRPDALRPSVVPVHPAAHIRRANPRDGIDFASRIVSRHLVFRRGMPYERTATGEVGNVRGLLFMACCADIRRQFEFVQSQWLQDGDRFGLGSERDPLTGIADPSAPASDPGPEDDGNGNGPTRTASIDVRGHRVRPSFASFVTMRGGEYTLLPSRSALRLLGQRGDR